MEKEQLEIFAMGAVAMHTFKARFEKAKAKKEKRFEELNANYKPGSSLFVQKRDEIMPEFNMEVEAARDEILSEFTDVYEKVVAKEKAAVSVTGASVNNVLETLKCLEGIPVSVDEYSELVKTLGNKLYWIDRALEKTADRWGITETGVQPSLTVKMQVLDRLKKDVSEYVEEYDGEKKCFPVTSSDQYIYQLESEYTNGYSGVRMSGKEQAKRMVSKALGKGDSLERACMLSNMIRTSSPEMQEELLGELAEHNSTVLLDPTMKFIGVQDVIEKFKKENSKNIQAADEAMEKIKNADSHPERLGVMCDNYDNKHFRKAIEDLISTTNDKKLKDSYENLKEVKREEAAGTSKH